MQNSNGGDHTISLLHPSPSGTAAKMVSGETIEDLDLDKLAAEFTDRGSRLSYIKEILFTLETDPEVLSHRQDILEDLLDNPSLEAGFKKLKPLFDGLYNFRSGGDEDQLLYEVTRRLGELETYIKIIEAVHELLEKHKTEIKSAGLHALLAMTAAILNERIIRNLKQELPELLKNVRSIKSVSIGVNLDHRLRPVEATLLSINKKVYDGASGSLMQKLFNIKSPKNEWKGIANLHRVPDSLNGRSAIDSDNSSASVHPLMVPLFRDLAEVLNKVCRPVADALRKYAAVNTAVLFSLSREITFYLGAVHYFRKLITEGFPVCRPRISAAAKREFTIRKLYNPNLAVRLINGDAAPGSSDGNGRKPAAEKIVFNDSAFEGDKRIFVLTGPNRGGKTTYMQAVGMTQVLAQAGLFVPGRDAAISPVEDIHTHFPKKEQPDLDAGRFGEEAQRLSALFAEASSRDLILLNESLSNTSHSESLYLCRDLIRIFLLLGARTIFATHLHELAAELEELNRRSSGESRAVSLVSLIKDGGDDRDEAEFRRTFKIVEGPPAGSSYAREIAAHYGITFEQLNEKLKQRGSI
jgi:DNA mismatch repair protein MutS